MTAPERDADDSDQADESAARLRALKPIDCDIHPPTPVMAELLPYLDDHWHEVMVSRGIDGLGLASYPPGAALSARPEWRGADGRPGGDLDLLRREALAPWNTRLAICHCLHGAAAMFSEDMGAALARAVNDWVAAEWLDREPLLRASILVSPRSAELAVAEIERCAADPRFVAVLLLAGGEMPLGRRAHWPIYAAAARLRLPIGIHAGSDFHNPITNVGWPSYLVEDYVDQAVIFQHQLLSLIGEGVFTKFPDLRVVLIESGFTWLPAFLWRATKEWRALRSEVPWVDRSPAEIVREHVRVTLQPTDAPPAPEDLARVMEQIGAERLLLFSTDFPHWQWDGGAVLPAGLPARLLPRIAVETPLETFPRLRHPAVPPRAPAIPIEGFAP
ncbi:MAG TPA: amidohydrolase family protein [Acetobacteraceae bacterium]|nr:amidohydrolase family protein [Acetobacteraceae bacterium]